MNEREVLIKTDGRAEGQYSLYVHSGNNQGPWYTGLTFGSLRQAQKEWA